MQVDGSEVRITCPPVTFQDRALLRDTHFEGSLSFSSGEWGAHTHSGSICTPLPGTPVSGCSLLHFTGRKELEELAQQGARKESSWVAPGQSYPEPSSVDSHFLLCLRGMVSLSLLPPPGMVGWSGSRKKGTDMAELRGLYRASLVLEEKVPESRARPGLGLWSSWSVSSAFWCPW